MCYFEENYRFAESPVIGGLAILNGWVTRSQIETIIMRRAHTDAPSTERLSMGTWPDRPA